MKSPNGAKQQFNPSEDTRTALYNKGICCVKAIVGALLYYTRAVDNKIIFGISSIGVQRAAATESTAEAINHLLDYCSTYPNNGIVFRASDMVLAAHSEVGFNNESKAHSRAGANIFLSENDQVPRWNGPILTNAQIICLVMSSAAKTELGGLFIAAKDMVPIHHTLIEMGWPQPPALIQNENSTAAGVVDNTIVPRKIKSTDLRFHWLRCHMVQVQFCFCWAPGYLNWGDYSTKNHTPAYHESNNPLFAGEAFYFLINK